MIKNFFYRLKNFNKSNILFFLIFVLSFILSFLIFITLIGNIPNLEEVKNVSKLIQTNYILVIILIIISIKKIVDVFYSQKLKSPFKVKITSLFIFITLKNPSFCNFLFKTRIACSTLLSLTSILIKTSG